MHEDEKEQRLSLARAPLSSELVCAGKNASDLSKALKQLDRTARQTFLDRGIWPLYLALGVLSWAENDGDVPSESPLLLIPVSLERDGQNSSYRLVRTDDDPVVNPALAVKLDTEFGLQLPSGEDWNDVAIDSFFSAVGELVSGMRGWHVSPRAVLSVFSFFKEVMYRDLLDHEDELVAHPLIQAVGLGPDAPQREDLLFDVIREDELDAKAPPENMVSILDADGSQRRCIVSAREGRSFVMDGPPGTGKSQTIANIIAELLRAGKSVLFVSEKSAALDVVNDRLRHAGLGPFLLQLHSQNATRKAVAQELGAALRERPRALSGPMARERLALLKRRREALSSYAQAMNEVRSPLGKSLHDILGLAAGLHAVPAPPATVVDAESFSLEDYLRLLETAEALARAWGPVERSARFLWKNLSEGATPAKVADAGRISELALRSLNELVSFSSSVADVLGTPAPTSVADTAKFLELLITLEGRDHVPTAWLTSRDFWWIRSQVTELQSASRLTVESAVAASEVLGPSWREVDAEMLDKGGRSLRLLALLSPPKYVTEDVELSHFRAEVSFLKQGKDVVDRIVSACELVSVHFSLTSEQVTLTRVREYGELAMASAGLERPLASWVDPSVQMGVEAAIRELEPVVEQWQALNNELSGVFRREVLDADLPGLSARFDRQHHGLRKLGGEYRADKQSLATLTVAGKADAVAVQALGKALAWQACSAKLSELARRHSRILGGYYAGEDTDFDQIRRALEIARRAAAVAMCSSDVHALGETLASSAPDSKVSSAGRQLLADLDTLESGAEGVIREEFCTLRQLPLMAIGKWFADAAFALEGVLDAAAELGSRVGRVLDPAKLEEAVDRLNGAIIAEAQLAKKSVVAEEVLGYLWRMADTDWGHVEAMLDWAEAVRTHFQGTISEGVAVRMLSVPLESASLRAAIEKYDQTLAALGAHFIPSYWAEMRADLRGDIDDARALLAELRTTTGDGEEWLNYQVAREQLRSVGFGEVVDYCIAGKLSRELVGPVIERAALDGWVRSVLDADGARLGPMRSDDRDALVSDFANLDKEVIELASAVIIDACSARRPTTLAGAAAIINREAEKQKRHMPIRDLLGSTGTVAQLLKPCFVMSPLAVSQFLPGDMRFDAVIFDEASQIRPADAINCLYRGHQLIVAGDQKQLPPTDFFQGGESTDDEYEEGQLDDFTSVLDLCKAAGAFESLPLRWHYRSAHEALVTYSNYKFYDGKLLTFPAALQEGDSLGVRFIKVDGIYRRGGARDNPIEARAVVDRILFHRRQHPRKSLGVVAFSSAQEDAILAELESRAEIEPELRGILSDDDRLNGFFVKPLESVQGDERDIIIFSIGYGPDENGKFTMQMGPLTQAGGWRRLNVAITRARELVEAVSSITAEDISVDANSEGVRHLRGYLDFARRGVASLAVDIGASGLDAESPFEEDVLRTIRSWGYEVVPQLGVAGYRLDLAVRHPSKPGLYVLGVECDGAMYHSSKVARDRDRLRQGVLVRLGWRIYRIWGPSWYRDRTNQELRLREAIEIAVDGGAVVATSSQVPTAVEVVHEEADFDAPPTWSVPYVSAPPWHERSGYELHEDGARYQLRRLIKHVVTVEQPVHKDRVIRAALEAWSLGRAGNRIRQNFSFAVKELAGTVVESEDGFLSTPGYVLRAVRTAGSPSDSRPVREVPVDEIQLAILNIVGDAHSIDSDELGQYVARVFGWQRRGSEIQHAIERAVSLLESSDLLVVDARGVVTLRG